MTEWKTKVGLFTTGSSFIDNDNPAMDTIINDLWNDYRDKKAPNFEGGENKLIDLLEPTFGPATFTGSTLNVITAEKDTIVGNMLTVLKTMKDSSNSINNANFVTALDDA